MTHTPTLTVLAACSLAAPWAAAQSRIEQVTVYPGLAAVERSARVAAGARELVLNCLSPSFDMASLRVEGSEGLRIGPVSATNRPRAEVPECSTSPLDARIRALEDRLAALDAEKGGHEFALGYLRALGTPAEGASAATRSGAPAALPGVMAGIQRAGQQTLAEQSRIAREREPIERELAPLRAERERAMQPSGEVRQVRIALAAPREGSVRLRYQVAGPTWAPSYRATLDAEAGTVELERLAQVSQRTGEDWTGVALRLSTGSPRGATSGPQPRRWELSLRPPPAAVAAAPAAAMSARNFAPAMKAAQDGGGAEQPADFSVQVAQGEFATEFVVPGAVDVGSGAQRINFTLGSSKLPATVKVQTTPALDASAWLVAELAPPDGVWPDGPLQLLRGTQVAGQSVWRRGTREKLTLPFGRDEQVRVQVDPVPQKTASTGFISTRTERRVGRSYTVENLRRTAIGLEVLEATPVATDEQITVTRQFDPAPRPGNWQEQPGIVAWTTTLAPGQRARFTAEYVISYPKDLPVSEQR